MGQLQLFASEPRNTPAIAPNPAPALALDRQVTVGANVRATSGGF